MSEEQEKLDLFEELFRRHYPRLCQRVHRITRDVEAAEDIVQEVFVRFWASGEWEAISNPEAYLYRMALNGALNHTATRKRRAALSTTYAAQLPLQAHHTVQELELAELQQKADDAIAALPPACRQVFLLSRYEEMSHKEIAAFLGISPNTVDNHIKKALAILRKALLGTLLPLAEIYFNFFA